jgi:Fic family protein
MKFSRRTRYKRLPIHDKQHAPFVYLFLDEMTKLLRVIDLGAGGSIGTPEPLANPQKRDSYHVSSLMEEAITSSQIEGATTTRPVAKEMLRSGRSPRDLSERMILNNFLAIRHIGKIKKEPLSKDRIFELHRIMTEGTLKREDAAGRFRTDDGDEKVEVVDAYGSVLHDPPPAHELDQRLSDLCDFANGKPDEPFLHPVLRSILLHFWLAYDHPFVDGNGRTARALFYWSMLHHGYWLCEFISISQVIRKARTKYGQAFLYTETDDNDLTYFLLYHLDLIETALQDLHDYIQRKTAETVALDRQVRQFRFLNHRQQALINHALRHPDQTYTIASHERSHSVTYQTARTDLQSLERMGLLRPFKVGRTWHYAPEPELADRLARLRPEDIAKAMKPS